MGVQDLSDLKDDPSLWWYPTGSRQTLDIHGGSWAYLADHGFHRKDIEAICSVRHRTVFISRPSQMKAARLKPGEPMHPKNLKRWESSRALFLELDPPYIGQKTRRVRAYRKVVYPVL